ncbi:hypothetical protein [Methanothrix sp.]
MSTKTITITEEAYERLKSRKGKNRASQRSSSITSRQSGSCPK